jgi:hypothetical protein
VRASFHQCMPTHTKFKQCIHSTEHSIEVS